MVKVIDDNFMVCADCYTIIGTGDYTSFDYYYSEDEATAKIDEIEANLKLIDGVVYPGKSENDKDFSTTECDCCGGNLAGSRHHCVIMK